MDGLLARGTFNIVRRVSVTEGQLQDIARILGIPEAEQGQLHSGIIYIDLRAERPRRRAGRAATGRAATGRAATTRPRRRQE